MPNTAPVKTYKDLVVYQKAKLLTVDVIKYFSKVKISYSIETEYWLEMMLDLEEFDTKIIEDFINRNNEICRMLSGLLKNMKGGSQS